MRKGIVVGLVVVVAATSLPVAGAYEPTGSSPEERLMVSIPMDVAAWQEAIDAAGAFTLPLAGDALRLVVHEHDLFVPGHKRVVEIDTDWNLRVVEEVTARTFFGHVAGTERSSVVVTLDAPKDAVYGSIYLPEQRLDLTTERAEDGRAFLVLVFNEHQGFIPSLPRDHHKGVGLNSAGNTGLVWVDADSSYRSYASDWTTRVTNAFAQQHSMWDNEVDIHLSLVDLANYLGSFSTDCSTHLSSYRSYVAELRAKVSGFSDYSNFQRFTGVNLAGCYGMGYSPALKNDWAASIVEAKDHEPSDSYYDPDLPHDLGILSATEQGHNYGEGDHPQDNFCESWTLWWCNSYSYNVMAGGNAIPSRDFWFASGSETDITGYAWPIL